MEKALSIGKIFLIALCVIVAVYAVQDQDSLDAAFTFTYVVIGAVVVAMLGGAVFNFIEDPTKGLSLIAGIILLVVVGGIAYGLSRDELDPVTQEVIEGSRLVEAGLYTLYVVVAVAVTGVLFSSVRRVFK